MNALVFNCSYNGLSIIQELGRRGLSVLALDTERSIGTFSRYAYFQKCPDPLIAEDEFIRHLLNLGRTFSDKPVLFPTNDQWVTAVSRNKDALSEYYYPCVADWSAVQLLIDKQLFYRWAQSKKYPVPYTWESSNLNEIPDRSFPLAAKPKWRRISGNDSVTQQYLRQIDRLRLSIINNRSDLMTFVEKNAILIDHFIFQEYVVGMSDRMYTLGVYVDRKSEVLGLFSGRKVRGFPPDNGDCIMGQVEDVPVELKNMVKQICADIGYHGIAEFEFKKDAVTGDFRLIEINPRSWSWIGITPACGVSLPWLAYADLSLNKTLSYTESTLVSGSVKYVKILVDFFNCIYFNRHSGFPTWHMSLSDWWRSLRGQHVIMAEFSRDDLLPGIYALFSAAAYFLKGIIRS